MREEWRLCVASNIYSGGFMEPFDVRGYARFIKEHQLSAKDIMPEIMQKFVK